MTSSQFEALAFRFTIITLTASLVLIAILEG
jgi:hypothetical protein